MDFVGFTYNGKHSIDDLHIYRVSSSNRYNDNIIPTLTDKTAEVPGGDGMYFFNTYHKQKQFTLNIAFDNLTEEGLRLLRQTFDGKDIHDLIFDEYPDRAYKAKVTGTPNIKYIPFDKITRDSSSNVVDAEEGAQSSESNVVSTPTEVIYKGEGTLQFTCYFPYGLSLTQYDPSIQGQNIVGGELPTTFVATRTNAAANTVWTVTVDGDAYSITIPDAHSGTITWDSSTGLVMCGNTPINFSGNSVRMLPVGATISINTGTLKYYNRYY